MKNLQIHRGGEEGGAGSRESSFSDSKISAGIGRLRRRRRKTLPGISGQETLVNPDGLRGSRP